MSLIFTVMLRHGFFIPIIFCEKNPEFSTKAYFIFFDDFPLCSAFDIALCLKCYKKETIHQISPMKCSLYRILRTYINADSYNSSFLKNNYAFHIMAAILYSATKQEFVNGSDILLVAL